MEVETIGKKGAGGTTAAAIMITFVVLLLGMALFPAVIEFTNAAVAQATGATATIINLIPLFYALLILAAAAVPVILAFKAGR